MPNKRCKENLRKNNKRKGRILQRGKTRISSMINTMKRIDMIEEDTITSREGEDEVMKMIENIDDANLLLRIKHYIII